MLVCAVPDPSAFDSSHFDDLYKIQAEDFLSGIKKNGILIVDKEKRLQDNLIKQIGSIPTKFGQNLLISLAELLKNKRRRIVMLSIPQDANSTKDLLDLAYHLKTVAEPDALIVSDENLNRLKSEQKDDLNTIPLSNYRNSDFEKTRQEYENQFGSIDTLLTTVVDDLLIRAMGHTRWLRFYDPYIGKGNNTKNYLKSIKYILTLWSNKGLFANEQDTGKVEIFTCCSERIRDNETEHAKSSKQKQNQIQHRKVIRELIEPLKNQFPIWQIELLVKNESTSNRIFHARYLETQQAIIRIDKGFDLFKQNGGFRRNFFTLNMAESSHLKECRNLQDAVL